MVVNHPNSLHKDVKNFRPYKFKTKVNVPRVKHGKRQELESTINEEAMLLANFIRGKRIWEARTAPLPAIPSPRQIKDSTKHTTPFEPLFPSVLTK